MRLNPDLLGKRQTPSLYPSSDSSAQLNRPCPPEKRTKESNDKRSSYSTTPISRLLLPQSTTQLMSFQSVHLRPTNTQKSGKFTDEFNVLQESWHPSSISHRDIEKQKIRMFINEGIKSKGSETSLYITGLPGLGKTASVFELIQQYSTDPNIQTLYINALKLTSTCTFYKELWQQITGKTVLNNDACKRLAAYFRSRQIISGDRAKNVENNLKKTKILIIDEVDYLLTKKQEILYNIYDWMHTKNSHLVIISIANTLDFPNKLFPKIQSRMGRNVLVFKPYSSSEIVSILNERLGHSEIFSKDALVYVAKKVANFSSDIRKSLHIVRKALQMFVKSGNNRPIIDIELINRVFEIESQKPLVSYIENSSEIFRCFLISVLIERVVKNASVFETESVYYRLNSLLRNLQRDELSFSEFLILVDRAKDMSLVKRVFDALKRMKMEIAVDPEEIAFALRNDEVFNKYGPVILFNK